MGIRNDAIDKLITLKLKSLPLMGIRNSIVSGTLAS